MTAEEFNVLTEDEKLEYVNYIFEKLISLGAKFDEYLDFTTSGRLNNWNADLDDMKEAFYSSCEMCMEQA